MVEFAREFDFYIDDNEKDIRALEGVTGLRDMVEGWADECYLDWATHGDVGLSPQHNVSKLLCWGHNL